MRDQDLPNSRRRAFDADTYQSTTSRFRHRPTVQRDSVRVNFRPSRPSSREVVQSRKSGFGLVKLSDASGDGFLHGTVAGSMLTSTMVPS